MFVIVSKKNSSIHREPNKKSYGSTQYKNAGAAKAGITRTMKYYATAIAQVNECVANGEKEYMAPKYNAYRDATDVDLGRTHCADINNYVVMSLTDYKAIEPMITRTGTSPYNGETITVTQSINTPSYMDPLCESYYTR